jgi:hypothetical protein
MAIPYRKRCAPGGLSLAVLLALLGTPGLSRADDETIAKWEPNKANNFYRTSTKMTKGAEVRIKVVSCPKDRANGIVLWRTAGDQSKQLKRWDDIAAGQILKTTLDDDIVVSISTAPSCTPPARESRPRTATIA